MYFSFLSDRIFAYVESKSGDGINVVLLTSEGMICSCAGFHYRGRCSHSISVLKELLNDHLEDYKKIIFEEKKMRVIKSDINRLDELMGGGMPIGILVGFHGSPQTGKTTLMAQLSVNVLLHKSVEGKTNANALFIDLEGGLADILDMWREDWSKRYGINLGIISYALDMEAWHADPGPDIPLKLKFEDKKKYNLIVIRVTNLEEFALIHGRQIRISRGKKTPKSNVFEDNASGKIEIIPMKSWSEFKDVLATPIGRWVNKHNVVSIVYDSFSAPFTGEFTNLNQSYPGRSAAEGIILNQAQSLAEKRDLVVMCAHHTTRDPSSYAGGVPTGGKMVGHNFKFVYYIKKGNTAKNKGSRIVSRSRHPRGSFGEVMLTITNTGFIDA